MDMQLQPEAEQLESEFAGILSTQGLMAVYQPIISLQTGNILGWEALTRGPEGSYFQRPDVIFSFAENNGLLFATEKICRTLAINNFGAMEAEQKLFLNVHPRTVGDAGFIKGETMELVREYGWHPNSVVFEITERHSIDDYEYLKKTLEHYRNQGYQVAVDDVGAGFSGLYSIAEINPDFIKIDMSLVRNVDKNPERRAVVGSLLDLAVRIGCQVIAEGVETAGELKTLIALGVPYGQGYYLVRPAFPKPFVPETLVTLIREQSQARNRRFTFSG